MGIRSIIEPWGPLITLDFLSYRGDLRRYWSSASLLLATSLLSLSVRVSAWQWRLRLEQSTTRERRRGFQEVGPNTARELR